jgi:Sec7-like guanine-nucleotide exchange factor
MQRELAVCPPREPEDTAATYLEKLESTVHRKAIATILSQSADEFYATGLRKYIRGFSFFGDPMDMAIRKFLMEAELPKETQQIDRVLQAFANRYHECNPGIFASPGKRSVH